MRFLFVDQILNREHPNKITGVKHITPEDSFLCKIPESDQYCFIPTLVGETVGQLAAWHIMQQNNFTLRPVAGVVAEAILHQPAYVGQTLLLECEIVSHDEVAVEYHGHASVNGELVFSVNGAIGPMLPMEQFIDKKSVQQQFLEIDRPGTLEDLLFYPADSVIAAAECQEYLMQFDKVYDIHPKKSCKAFKKISRSSLYFADHFPNKPVLPLTVLLECKRRLAQDFLFASEWFSKYRLLRMEKIKMSDFVQPGDVIQTELMVKKISSDQLILHLRTFLPNKRICVVDLVYQAEGSCSNVVSP
ncbi:MAG: Hydroxymyristoyl-ACP dehydratase [Pseudomonadota bacterium]|nr:Hydroxymyristoyl-ACP dehydratase [Pseudomonadota bacterium]